MTDPTDRIVDRRERRRLVPYSDQHVTRLEKVGRFPRRIRLGPGRVGWSLCEIEAWIADHKALRQAGAA